MHTPSHGPTLHLPATGPSGVTAPVYDPVASSVRNQVVDRMVRMSVRHAAHAWRHRRDRPVAPHAVAFLYAEPTGDTFFRVVAATRMVNDDPSVRDLPRLLHRLATLARERYLPTSGGFDPAAQMTTHHDAGTGAAPYIGIGVSTLDTPAAMWDDIQRDATDIDDLPGRCFAVLVDQTAVLIDRGASRDSFGAVTVRSTADLNIAPGIAGRMWIHHPDTSSMPAPVDVWERLDELHRLTLHQARRPTL